MTNYEKDLKVLKSEIQNKVLFLENETELDMTSLRRLQAMGLIELEGWADDLLRISLTQRGEFYDDFKKEEWKARLAVGTKEVVVAVISGGLVLLLTQIFN